jgi:curved DNA-binding protein
MPNPVTNLYAILGVSSSASQSEIQAAYRRRARELHPDVNTDPDAEDRFKQLVEAYAVLKDERRRARYDAFGGRRSSRRRTRRPGEHVRYEDVRVGTDDLRSSVDDFLDRNRSRRKERAATMEVRIGLADAYTGTTIEVPIETGRGFGRSAPVRVEIPPGAKTGDRLALPEHGILLRLKIEPEEGVVVDGRDVKMSTPITPWEAALGRVVGIRAPHRVLEVRIPRGTSSGRVLRVRGQGLPQKPGRAGAPGDLYVEVRIEVPGELSPDERRLFERLAEVSRFDPRD